MFFRNVGYSVKIHGCICHCEYQQIGKMDVRWWFRRVQEDAPFLACRPGQWMWYLISYAFVSPLSVSQSKFSTLSFFIRRWPRAMLAEMELSCKRQLSRTNKTLFASCWILGLSPLSLNFCNVLLFQGWSHCSSSKWDEFSFGDGSQSRSKRNAEDSDGIQRDSWQSETTAVVKADGLIGRCQEIKRRVSEHSLLFANESGEHLFLTLVDATPLKISEA